MGPAVFDLSDEQRTAWMRQNMARLERESQAIIREIERRAGKRLIDMEYDPETGGFS